MPDTFEWPRRPRRRRFLVIVALLAVIVFGSRTVLSYFVDALWFGSLGYSAVFRRTLELEWGIFATIAGFTFLVLYGTFLALKRAHLRDLPSSRTILFGGQPITLPIEPVLRV